MMFKKAVLVIASLICLTQLVLTSPAHATVRIMLLGDSITEGSSSGVQPDLDAYYVSYRMALRELLTAAGYDVDFVGSLNSGSAVFPDPDHEGHGGWDAAGAPDGKNIDSYVYAWLEAQDQRGVPVDIVLLHIGTNDVSANAAYASDVAAILNEIDRYEAAFQRDVWVVVALIINRVGYPSCTACVRTTSFNVAVKDMVNARTDDKVIIADMEREAGINYHYSTAGGDMWDAIHPYERGYEKMANRWFTALQEILPAKGVVIDNGEAGTSSTGTWAVSGGSQPYGADSLWARNGAKYTWQFDSQPPGTYEVLMWWSGWSSRATSIPVAISHADGTTTLNINQKQNAGMWNSLCTYYFDSRGSVTITAASGSTVSTCADAVWFRLVSANSRPAAFIDGISCPTRPHPERL